MPTPFAPQRPTTFAPANYALPQALTSRPAAPTVRPAAVAPPQLAAPTPPARTVRGQMGEEAQGRGRPAAAAPSPLRIPTPEELGLAVRAPATAPTADWAALHRRLQGLAAAGVHLDALPGGSWRASFDLPTGQPNQLHRVRAEGASPEAAVQLALVHADAWRAEARK